MTNDCAICKDREYHTMHEAWAVCHLDDKYFKVDDPPGTILTMNNPEIPFAR